VACTLLCATDGDAGRTSDVKVTSRAALGAARRAELHAAARILGVRDVWTLGLGDGVLPQADADALTGEIVRFLRTHRPQVVVTFGPEGAPNAHRDHRAISRAATAAFFLAGLTTAFADQLDDGLAPHVPARLYYASWEPPRVGGPISVEAVPLTARLDARPWNGTKVRAFEAHRTQHVLRGTFLATALFDAECFALAAGVPQPAPVVDDLFAGLG
jgi:LmbE family N-acetylglucosaminyl deacetylase